MWVFRTYVLYGWHLRKETQKSRVMWIKKQNGIYFLNENVCMCKRLMGQIKELAQENRKNIMSIMMMLENFVAR